MSTQPTCHDRLHDSLADRLDDIRALLDAPDNETDDLGSLCDYGLEVRVVPADTFDDQPAPYVEYLLSWGGPSDMFRLHPDGRIEYRYHDWFDGAGTYLTGTDHQTAETLFSFAGYELAPGRVEHFGAPAFPSEAH